MPFAFEHDERRRHAALVGQADVNGANPPALHQRGERRGELEVRPTRGVVHDADAVPVHGRADSGAHRLGERLLGGEPLGEVGGWLPVAGEAGELTRHEDLVREAIAPAFERLLDAGDLHQIGADAENHPLPRIAPPTISVFISRTASRMPMKTARLTIACPMCSSRTPASCATGSTLK